MVALHFQHSPSLGYPSRLGGKNSIEGTGNCIASANTQDSPRPVSKIGIPDYLKGHNTQQKAAKGTVCAKRSDPEKLR